jgi:hypothetical protein
LIPSSLQISIWKKWAIGLCPSSTLISGAAHAIDADFSLFMFPILLQVVLQFLDDANMPESKTAIVRQISLIFIYDGLMIGSPHPAASWYLDPVHHFDITSWPCYFFNTNSCMFP